ncbi:glutathione S-transferase family protein [uncultured Maricaulis sp.]|uniref:glutathione S-transferase family protein n=1 Tax=uncultured Maricaulis sp. TaxID=174710 RepID=UPI0026079CB8|nr:glutathione S-transferase family protein [uncultured Maricaulis sp.]
MTALTLYFCPRTRGFHALWMLEEIGEPYDLRLVNIRDDIQSEAYAAVNPMRKVPALDVGGELITESPAICTWLADRFADKGLAPAVDAPGRGSYLRWLFFAGSVIEPAFIDKAMSRETPRQMAGWGDLAAVKASLIEALDGKEYLVGDRFTAADLMVGSTLNFMMNFNLLERVDPFAAYVGRLVERPAYKRAMARESELAG